MRREQLSEREQDLWGRTARREIKSQRKEKGNFDF
jgi:hypothetical protein